MHPSLTVIFDGSCDFCTRSVRWLRALDRRGRIKQIPFQNSAARRDAGLTIAECEQAVWAIADDGSRYRGAAAVNVALGTSLGFRLPWLFYRLPGVRQLQDWAYAVVARHRHRLPGDTPHCQRHPDECR